MELSVVLKIVDCHMITGDLYNSWTYTILSSNSQTFLILYVTRSNVCYVMTYDYFYLHNNISTETHVHNAVSLGTFEHLQAMFSIAFCVRAVK
jgi:hypothetical protein